MRAQGFKFRTLLQFGGRGNKMSVIKNGLTNHVFEYFNRISQRGLSKIPCLRKYLQGGKSSKKSTEYMDGHLK